MGSYAAYIWSCYAVSGVVIAALVIRALRQPKP